MSFYHAKHRDIAINREQTDSGLETAFNCFCQFTSPNKKGSMMRKPLLVSGTNEDYTKT